MCKVIMPIKPKYVKEILAGKKKYEFRKLKCNKDVESIIIYCTSPVKKIVGEVKIIEVLVDTPLNIWGKTKRESGMTEEDFFVYFNNKDIAVAYKLGEIIKYNTNKGLEDYGIKKPPQSYVYYK